VGFGFRLSARIQCVLDPWSAVGNGLAGKALVRRDNLRELHKAMNAALAKSEADDLDAISLPGMQRDRAARAPNEIAGMGGYNETGFWHGVLPSF
jgi:hypothetical protein